MKFFISCAKALEYLMVDEAKAMAINAEGEVQLDIQPARKSDKPKAEPATAS